MFVCSRWPPDHRSRLWAPRSTNRRRYPFISSRPNRAGFTPEPEMLILCVSLVLSCFYFNKCINVFVHPAFLSLTALRAHRSSRSSSRQTLNTKLAYEAASPTWRTRRIQTCGVTSCVGTSRLIASPAWLLRSDAQTFCLIVISSRGSPVLWVVLGLELVLRLD